LALVAVEVHRTRWQQVACGFTKVIAVIHRWLTGPPSVNVRIVRNYFRILGIELGQGARSQDPNQRDGSTLHGATSKSFGVKSVLGFE
jgi:hypothetical protein